MSGPRFLAGLGALALLNACTSRTASTGSPASAPPSRTPVARTSPAPLPSVAPAPGLAVRMQGGRQGSRYVTVRKQKGNRIAYDLRADSETGQYLGGDTGRSEFQKPHVTFYGEHGTLVADAPRGTVVEKDKTVRMSGGVHAHTADGRTLTSDTLSYDDETEQLTGEGNVVVTLRTGERFAGDRMYWNLHSGRIDFQGAR